MARSYSLSSAVHSSDNICRASTGWSARHRCYTYPTHPTEESHFHLASPMLCNSRGERKIDPMGEVALGIFLGRPSKLVS